MISAGVSVGVSHMQDLFSLGGGQGGENGFSLKCKRGHEPRAAILHQSKA